MNKMNTIEKRCKICGEWKGSRGIAMHYWNCHRVKYGEMREGEETREVEDINNKREVIDEKKTSQEERKDEQRKEQRRIVVEEYKFVDRDSEVVNEWCR